MPETSRVDAGALADATGDPDGFAWCVAFDMIWSVVTPGLAVLRKAWGRWKLIARVIGNFQARVLLTVFYLVVTPPFAFIVKIFRDPLALRPPAGGTFWTLRPVADSAEAGGRRQF